VVVYNKYICRHRANKVEESKVTQVHLPYYVAVKEIFVLLHQQKRFYYSVSTMEIIICVKCTDMSAAAIRSNSKRSTGTNKPTETIYFLTLTKPNSLFGRNRRYERKSNFTRIRYIFPDRHVRIFCSWHTCGERLR